MMNMVNEMYTVDGVGIPWVLNSKGELKKENYDACDSLICALAYVNINHHGLDEPKIISSNIVENEDGSYTINYSTKIWDRVYNKTLNLQNQ